MIVYLALIAMVCVLIQYYTPPPVLAPFPSFRDPEAMKRAVSRQLEDILRTGGYCDAKVLISGNTCHVFKRGVPVSLVAQEVMRQRTIVETMNKLGVRVLEIRHLDFFPVDPYTYELK
jgi:hypothetical protein